MLFNSFTFLAFLTIVFLCYWSIRNRRQQNLLLILASYVFYGWWDWRFLSLIAFSSCVDYFIGLRIHNTVSQRLRQRLLWCSIISNLGLLGFFKYYDFFIDSAVVFLQALGFEAHISTLRIILPVGISFYTFQTLSYTIDIYRRQMEPTRDAIAFFAFVSFFPQLVAGPIERARQLLPQFERGRSFLPAEGYAGLRQMLWGFFKKIVVADHCAIIADYCFNAEHDLNWYSYVLGVVFFAFQIYGDFSGYSDIAIGCARLFGFRLMRNFAYPYFSRDIAEFWRRWHISLSTWFRDYVYIPLGGSLTSKWRRIRNILITFTVSGLWHGANWNFVFWGLLNGLYYVPLLLTGKHKAHVGISSDHALLPNSREAAGILLTFILTCLGWIFFRAEDMGAAFNYLANLLTFRSNLEVPISGNFLAFCIGSGGIFVILGFEWWQRKREFALEHLPVPRLMRWLIYWLLAFLVMSFFGSQQSFIYFQF